MQEHTQPSERQQRITLRLPRDVHQKVKAAAAKDRRPLAVMIRLMIEDCMEQQQSAAHGGAP
jgi:hypothetical protein